MTDAEGEFWALDRAQKIRQIITENGEEKFYLSYSGGRDSTALSALIDEALPGNQIPRVFANTGLEYQLLMRFVRRNAETDQRIVEIRPTCSIPKMLQESGYPFKSKDFSAKARGFQRHGLTPYLYKFVNGLPPYTGLYKCHEKLRYIFHSPRAVPFKISDKCCHHLKVAPLDSWAKEHGKTWKITGLMREESGRRRSSSCVVLSKRGGFNSFNPLFVMSDAWQDWYITSRGIELCELYYPPSNCVRTGCVGCPFNPHIQRELDMCAALLPNERRKCERIFAPVYAEYRRIGYRLRQQLTIDDLQFIPNKEADT